MEKLPDKRIWRLARLQVDQEPTRTKDPVELLEAEKKGFVRSLDVPSGEGNGDEVKNPTWKRQMPSLSESEKKTWSSLTAPEFLDHGRREISNNDFRPAPCLTIKTPGHLSRPATDIEPEQPPLVGR